MAESEWTIDALKELFTDQLNSLKELVLSKFLDNKNIYEQRFQAQEQAVQKAEASQRDYNVKSNEFRAALDDANKTNIARTEAMALFKNLQDKVDNIKADIDNKIETTKGMFEKQIDVLRQDVVLLREFKSSSGGKEQVNLQVEKKNEWGVGIIISIVFGILAFLVSMIGIFLRFLGK